MDYGYVLDQYWCLANVWKGIVEKGRNKYAVSTDGIQCIGIFYFGTVALFGKCVKMYGSQRRHEFAYFVWTTNGLWAWSMTVVILDKIKLKVW